MPLAAARLRAAPRTWTEEDVTMELDLTSDQELFAATTRRFLEAESPLTTVRGLHEDPVGFARDFWRRGAELGWASLLVDEERGGGSISGRGLLDLVLVAEEMGRTVAPGPLVPVNVVASALYRAGASGGQADVVAGLVSGELIGTWAFAESNSTWDAAGVHLEAVSSGDEWVLDGTKTFVEDAS